MMSLDGFFAGPQGDLSWHNTDEEFNDFAIEQLDSAGGLLFGRVTYQMMASFWPSPAGLEGEPATAERMNSLPKFVFSRHMGDVAWNNTRLVTVEAPAEVGQLKRQPGKDLYLFGSANLASTFTRFGLIDEYRVMINPVVLGKGCPLFENPPDQLDLRLTQTRAFRNGNVLLTYHLRSQSPRIGEGADR